jgi:hypothetical protein
VTEEVRLVRRDRVGLFDDAFMAKIPFPLNAATYGDLWLTDSGVVGFSKVKWYAKDWAFPLAQVSEVRAGTMRDALSCYQGVAPKRLIHAKFGSKRYFVLFLGITHFMSKTDKAISHIPDVHGAGGVIAQGKSAWDNRGAKARALEARDVWLRVLTNNVPPSSLPELEAAAHQ